MDKGAWNSAAKMSVFLYRSYRFPLLYEVIKLSCFVESVMHPKTDDTPISIALRLSVYSVNETHFFIFCFQITAGRGNGTISFG